MRLINSLFVTQPDPGARAVVPALEECEMARRAIFLGEAWPPTPYILLLYSTTGNLCVKGKPLFSEKSAYLPIDLLLGGLSGVFSVGRR